MVFVCLWLCDSYRCSKLILIPKKAVIRVTSVGIPVLHIGTARHQMCLEVCETRSMKDSPTS